jgi:hypothetical protein
MASGRAIPLMNQRIRQIRSAGKLTKRTFWDFEKTLPVVQNKKRNNKAISFLWV